MSRRMSMHWVLLLALAGCPKKGPKDGGADAGGRGEPSGPTAGDSAPVPASESVADSVQRAAGLLAKGEQADWLKARDLLQRVLAEKPDDVTARLNLGVALHKLGDVDGAAQEFSRVTRTAPDQAQGWYYLGVTEQQLGDVDAALRHLRTGVDAAPKDATLRVAYVSALRSTGRAEEAVEAAKAALHVDSRLLPVYNEMALAWLDLKKPDAARFVLEKAESMDGGERHPAIQSNLGWLLYTQGERYGGEARLKKAVEIDPKYLPGLVRLASLYLDDRNFAAALPLLESASALAPKDHGVWMNLGVCYRGLARIPDARAAWEKALLLDPKNPAPTFNLGVLLGDDLKDYKAAIERLTSYVSQGGPEASLATTYIEQFQKDSSRAEQRRKAEEDRARRAKEKEDREKALREAEKATPAEKPADKVEPAPTDSTSPWGPTTPGGSP